NELNSQFTTSNKIIQLSCALSLFKNTSISASLLTNTFVIDNSWDGLGFSYQTDLLENFQYLISINQKFAPDATVCVAYKTQKSGVKLDGEGNLKAENNLPPDTYLFTPGNIGYGFQYRFFDKIKLSIESSHQFFDGDISFPVYSMNREKRVEIDEHHIWNNEIIFGANIEVIENLNIGFSFSKYLKYDDYFSEIRVKFTSPFTINLYYGVPSKPYSILGSVEYIYQNYRSSLHYQYSSMGYTFKSESGENYPLEISENSNFIKLVLSASFF
ncbi:MAG: hypothetical protein Q8M94_17860, partial [Ignavibacteria bacterium]|nr:hypothetical protein [Ignavibacteria bacterium]